MLEREFNYYKSHQDELNSKYEGQYIIIVGETVLGSYDSEEEAIQAASQASHAPGKFLLQFCSVQQDQTQYFRSRVAI